MQRADSLEKTLIWGRLKAGGERDDRGWDGWMTSPTWWTWVWASSGSWWWTGKPSMLQSMGLQRVRPVQLGSWTELMDLTFQVPMECCSLQHWTSLSPPDTSTTEHHFHLAQPLQSFWSYLCSSPVAYWTPTNPGSSSSGVISFCLFILFMGFFLLNYLLFWKFIIFHEIHMLTCNGIIIVIFK